MVLEGLDGAGKTTQVERMKEWGWERPPTFAHMPSGLTPLTEAIYDITEKQSIGSPLARQLLHLACHAENMDALVAGRDTDGLILDRWWWSTVAYGWFGAQLADTGVDEASFMGLIGSVWSAVTADVVLVFSNSYTGDPLNLRRVRDGYAQLLNTAGDSAVEIPAADPDRTTDTILQALRERDLLLGD